MNLTEIWAITDLPTRFEAMLDRYMELDEFTGNRTAQERYEMEEIAQAVMPELIKQRARLRQIISGQGRRVGHPDGGGSFTTIAVHSDYVAEMNRILGIAEAASA